MVTGSKVLWLAGVLSLALVTEVVSFQGVSIQVRSNSSLAQVKEELENAQHQNVEISLEVGESGTEYFSADLLGVLIFLTNVQLGARYAIRTSNASLARGSARATFECNEGGRADAGSNFPMQVVISDINFHRCLLSFKDRNDPGSSTESPEMLMNNVEIRRGGVEIESPQVTWTNVSLLDNSYAKFIKHPPSLLQNILVSRVVGPPLPGMPFLGAIVFESCQDVRLTFSTFSDNAAPVVTFSSCSAVMGVSDLVFRNTSVLSGTTGDQAAALVYTNSGGFELKNSVFTNNSAPSVLVTGKSLERQSVSGTIENCTFQDNTVFSPLKSAGLVFELGQEMNLFGISVQKCNFLSNTISGVSPVEAARGGAAHLDIRMSKTQVDFTNCNFTLNSVTMETLTPGLPSNASGGAIAVLFQSNVTGASVEVSNCSFHANGAVRGGAISVDYFDATTDNKFLAHNSTFVDNYADDTPDFPRSNVDRLANRGGGVSVLFSDMSATNIAQFQNNTFLQNHACYGGGLAVDFQGHSNGNSLIIEGSLPFTSEGQFLPCSFSSNWVTYNEDASSYGFSSVTETAHTGGAIDINLRDQSQKSQVTIRGCSLSKNNATEGGGVFIDFKRLNQGAKIALSNLYSEGNHALSGAAVALSAKSALGNGHLCLQADQTIELTDLTFQENVAFYRGALTVSSLEFSSFGQLIFKGNLNSALHLQNSLHHHHGYSLYEENVAQVGAGLLSSDSQTRVYPKSAWNFTGNVALTVGGAAFVFQTIR